MARSLILGVNGQDGSYLAEHLLRRGHYVVGVGRDPASRYILSNNPAFEYHSIDLSRDGDGLTGVLNSHAFDSVFHFAAVHGAAGFQYEPKWQQMLNVSVLSLQKVLDHARLNDRSMRIIYASSAKIFPAPLIGAIDENTAVRSTCLYSIGKIAARDLLAYYRRQHGIPTTNLIFFNHESVRRPPDYLMPILANALRLSRKDEHHKTTVRSLDFWIDWGAADEFMDIVADIATKSEAPELVMASGCTWLGRDAVKAVFEQHGLDSSRHIMTAEVASDPGPFFQARIERLEREVSRRPVKTIFNIVDDILGEK